jgi:hypothetical protein
MGRPTYVCATCSEHFTRKYSGQRHNFNIHDGRSEIVPFIEYMAGRSSGKYTASHPSWYRKQRGLQVNRSYQSNFESLTVADTGRSFRPENFQKRFPLPNESPYSNAPTAQQLSRPLQSRFRRGRYIETSQLVSRTYTMLLLSLTSQECCNVFFTLKSCRSLL